LTHAELHPTRARLSGTIRQWGVANMATTATFDLLHSDRAFTTDGWRNALSLTICTALPLGLFGLIHLGAGQIGHAPLFFTPFGLPGWTGAAAHLLQLALIGTAFGATMHARPRSSALGWLVAFGAACAVLPFVTPVLDSMTLALVCTLLFLLSVATTIRTASASKLAGWLLAPSVGMLGLSSAMGLAVAAYAPPFALTQAQHPAPTV
jgi:hypothetical protein